MGLSAKPTGKMESLLRKVRNQQEKEMQELKTFKESGKSKKEK